MLTLKLIGILLLGAGGHASGDLEHLVRQYDIAAPAERCALLAQIGQLEYGTDLALRRKRAEAVARGLTAESLEVRSCAIHLLGQHGPADFAAPLLLEDCRRWLEAWVMRRSLRAGKPLPNDRRLDQFLDAEALAVDGSPQQRLERIVARLTAIVELRYAYAAAFIELEHDDSISGLRLLLEPLIVGSGPAEVVAVNENPTRFGSVGADAVVDSLLRRGTRPAHSALIRAVALNAAEIEKVEGRLGELRNPTQRPETATPDNSLLEDRDVETLQAHLAALLEWRVAFASKLAKFAQAHSLREPPTATAPLAAWLRWGKQVQAGLPKSIAVEQN